MPQKIAKREVRAMPNPTIETIKKIAPALGVSLDDLLDPLIKPLYNLAIPQSPFGD